MSWNSLKWVVAGFLAFLFIFIVGIVYFINIMQEPSRSLTEGDQAFWRSHFASAEQSYQRSLQTARVSAQQTRAYARLCRLYGYESKYSQALSSCEAAVQINPSSAEAEAQLGLTFAWMGNLDEALNHGQRALQLDDKNSAAAAYLAQSLAEVVNTSSTRDFTQALGIAKYAIDMQKDNPEAHRILGYIYQIQGNYELAASEYQQAVQLAPAFYAFYIDLGTAEYNLNHLAAAADAYNFALTLYPEDPGALRGRGWTWWAQGNYTKARADFKQVLQLDEQDAVAWSGLGWTYLKDDAREEARHAFEQALNIDAENQKAQEGLDAITALVQAEAEAQTQTVTEASQQPDIASSKETIKQALNAAVQVYAYNDFMEIYNICSGVLLSSDGYILTNAHCLGDAKSQSLFNKQGLAGIGYLSDPKQPPTRLYRAKVIEIDYKLDAVLLQIASDWNGNPLPDKLSLPFLKIGDSDALQPGDPVWSIGFPGMGGETLTITQGVISGFADRDGTPWIKTDMMTGPGSSGAMVVNENGELIGLHTQSWSDQGETSSRLSAERPINALKKLLEKAINSTVNQHE